jgi:hypothetical protein
VDWAFNVISKTTNFIVIIFVKFDGPSDASKRNFASLYFELQPPP